MREIVLDNLFKTKSTKIYGRVLKPLKGNNYLVVDSQGRSAVVSSSERWNATAGVEIQGGRIIGKASSKVVQKVYQV